MHILLDIDGVMVSAASWKKPEVLNDGFYIFKDIAVESLNKIIKATNASIILTTSHRFRFTLEQWNKVFASRNIFVSVDRFESKQPYLSRKQEILIECQNSKYDNQFIIIDDDKSLNGLPFELKKRLILTSPLIGLTDELANEAIVLLKNV